MTPIIFIIICFLSLLLLCFGTGSNKKVLFFFTAWQSAVISLAVLKVFEDKPNLFPLAVLGTVTLTFLLLRRTDTRKVNTRSLFAIHILRIPVELILYQLYLKGKVPVLMTFKGWNFDILMGISAFVLWAYALFMNRKVNRVFFIIWNVIGMAFLLFIVSLAILSSPLPVQQFAFDQPNVAVLEFPYCLLPTCVVPVVLMSHILLIQVRQKVIY